MKKFIILSALALTVSAAFAQINFGIKAGYNSSLGLDNLSSITSGNYNLTNVKAEFSNNFHAGIFTRIGLKKLYIQPELLYAMGKNNYTVTLNDVLNEGKTLTYDKFINISTVDVPVLIGYKIIDTKLFNLRAFAGPKIRFNAGSSLEFKNLVTNSSDITIDELKQDVKESQLGLEAGFGIDVLMFTLDARYNLIKDMYQTKLNDLTIEKLPANTFIVSLGFKF